MSGDLVAPDLPPSRQPWEPMTPEQAADILRGLDIPWYIAGGWALDLFIGRQTRAHGDLDIAVLRGDEPAVRSHLRDWELFVLAAKDTLTPWKEGDAFPQDTFAIWARQPGHELWQIEIVVERREGTRWSYRRDKAVGLHVADIGRRTSAGIPYLRPEIVLLYKSRQPRGSDETDFLTALPRLDPAQRSYLAAALWTTSPGHRWLSRL
jgi:hypothetical protein